MESHLFSHLFTLPYLEPGTFVQGYSCASSICLKTDSVQTLAEEYLHTELEVKASLIPLFLQHSDTEDRLMLYTERQTFYNDVFRDVLVLPSSISGAIMFHEYCITHQ